MEMAMRLTTTIGGVAFAMCAVASAATASHVAFISHPKVVAQLIEQAATASAK